MKGIAWECQIIDASYHKTIRTIDSSGKSPVYQGKTRKKPVITQFIQTNSCNYDVQKILSYLGIEACHMKSYFYGI